MESGVELVEFREQLIHFLALNIAIHIVFFKERGVLSRGMLPCWLPQGSPVV